MNIYTALLNELVMEVMAGAFRGLSPVSDVRAGSTDPLGMIVAAIPWFWKEGR